MTGSPNEGASESRTERGITVLQTLSPKWLRTSLTTWSESFVRPSYIVRTIVDSSSVGLRLDPHEVDAPQQLAESLEGVVLALDRDEHLGGRGQAVHGDQTERRRAVDEDEVEARRPSSRSPAVAAAPGSSPARARSPPRPGRAWPGR